MRPAMIAVGESQQLSEPACRRLLETVSVGRVALTRHALPVMIPVGFVLDGSNLVLRTRPESVLAMSPDDVVVAFEAGDFDPDTGSGWSVLVTGTMQKITDPSVILQVKQLRPTPWANDDRHLFVTITPGLVSGSCVERGADQPEARAALV